MANTEKAVETQLKNIETRTGKSLKELYKFIRTSGLTRHGEIRNMLKRELGMGHGDANTLVHVYFKSEQEATSPTTASASVDVLDGIYSDKKAHLRPIHDKLMSAINQFGSFEIAPKKSYVSLRRNKQFAMIGPATQTQIEIGLNVKGLKPTARLIAVPAGGMCQYKVRIASVDAVDTELIDWIRQAFDSAG